MKKKLITTFFILFVGSLCAEDEISWAIADPCTQIECPPTRSDNIPLEHVACAEDEYLTGYVQALVDMHYYEFHVHIIVKDKFAYVYNLPCNELIVGSILSFICDIPGICGAQPVLGCEYLNCCDPCDRAACVSPCPFPVPCCSPCESISGMWFPQSTILFAPLVADPRQVTNSAALRFNDDVIGKHVGAISFGDQFLIYRWFDLIWFPGELEAGIEAGIFSVFDLDHVKACMVNTDFFVAALFDYALDRWSARFRLWHLSSHIGDEFLLSNPGFDRKNLSDEGVDLFLSYQLCQPIRLYAGLGYIFDRDKEFPEHPIYIEFGSEIRVLGERDYFNRLYMQPFLAMHFRVWQEHNWDLDQTYALGVEWSKLKGIGRKFRLFVEYHQGYSYEGQFLRERSNYFAIKTEIGF